MRARGWGRTCGLSRAPRMFGNNVVVEVSSALSRRRRSRPEAAPRCGERRCRRAWRAGACAVPPQPRARPLHAAAGAAGRRTDCLGNIWQPETLAPVCSGYMRLGLSRVADVVAVLAAQFLNQRSRCMECIPSLLSTLYKYMGLNGALWSIGKVTPLSLVTQLSVTQGRKILSQA